MTSQAPQNKPVVSTPTPTDILGPAPDVKSTMAIMRFQWEVQGRQKRLVSVANYAAGLSGKNGLRVLKDLEANPLRDGYQLVNICHPYMTDREMAHFSLTADAKLGRPRTRFCSASAVTDPDLLKEAIEDLVAQMSAEVNDKLPPFSPGDDTICGIQHFSKGLNDRQEEVLMTHYGTGIWDRTGLIAFPHRESQVELKAGWQVVAIEVAQDFTYTFARGATRPEVIKPIIDDLRKQLQIVTP